MSGHMGINRFWIGKIPNNMGDREKCYLHGKTLSRLFIFTICLHRAQRFLAVQLKLVIGGSVFCSTKNKIIPIWPAFEVDGRILTNCVVFRQHKKKTQISNAVLEPAAHSVENWAVYCTSIHLWATKSHEGLSLVDTFFFSFNPAGARGECAVLTMQH